MSSWNKGLTKETDSRVMNISFTKKDKSGLIYGLIDPRYGIIRYVGQTVTTLNQRFEGHLKVDEKGCSYKENWIRKLSSLNLQPEPVVLAFGIKVPFITYLKIGNKIKPFYDFDSLDKEEIYFINVTKEECDTAGIKCVNSNNGGHGESSRYLSHEGKKHSKEWNKNISTGRRRNKKSPWNKGLTKKNDKRIARISDTAMNSEKFQTTHRNIIFRQKVSSSQKQRHFKNFIAALQIQAVDWT